MPDVVVVGGGIVGLSVAWSLKRRGAGRVTLLEKGSCGQGSTGKATGGVRSQFGSEVNVRLSVASLPYFLDWTAIHGGDVAYRPVGYLFLATTRDHLDSQARGSDLQRACGARVDLLSPEDVATRLPGVNLDGILGASFGPDDGLADPGAAVASLVSSCRHSGVVVTEGREVQAVAVRSGRAVGVRTTHGECPADVVVIAAGPWSPAVLAGTGFELPVIPRHRQVYRSTAVAGLPSPCPFVVDLGSGVYFHTDVHGLIFGGGDREGAPGLDESFHEDEAPRIIGLLSDRLPQVLEARLTGGWAGVRDMTPDHHGVLGWVPGIEGLMLATGFSGHGFMHAPAVGEEAARLALGEPAKIDLSALDPSRFAGQLRKESYVF